MYTGMNVGDVNILWANNLRGPTFYLWNDEKNKPHKVQSVHGSWDFLICDTRTLQVSCWVFCHLVFLNFLHVD